MAVVVFVGRKNYNLKHSLFKFQYIHQSVVNFISYQTLTLCSAAGSIVYKHIAVNMTQFDSAGEG